MDCAICGLPSARVRAVVDTADERVLGPACRTCVDRFFGRTLAEYAGDDDDCLLCERDGFYALPRWACRTVETNQGVLVTDQDAPVGPATPRLCQEHFYAFREETGAAAERARRPHPRSAGD